jgi:hypothetical protein
MPSNLETTQGIRSEAVVRLSGRVNLDLSSERRADAHRHRRDKAQRFSVRSSDEHMIQVLR